MSGRLLLKKDDRRSSLRNLFRNFSYGSSQPKFQTQSKLTQYKTAKDVCDHHVWSSDKHDDQNFVKCYLCKKDAPISIVSTINQCQHMWSKNTNPQFGITRHDWWKRYCARCHLSIY